MLIIHRVLDSLVVMVLNTSHQTKNIHLHKQISACHADGRGSIPRQGDFQVFFLRCVPSYTTQVDQDHMCSSKLVVYIIKRIPWWILFDPTVATIWSCLLTRLSQFSISLSACIVASCRYWKHCDPYLRVSTLVLSTRVWHSPCHDSRLCLPTISFVAYFLSPL